MSLSFKSLKPVLLSCSGFVVLWLLPFYSLFPRVRFVGPVALDDVLPMVATAAAGMWLTLRGGFTWVQIQRLVRTHPALLFAALFIVCMTVSALRNGGGLVGFSRTGLRFMSYGLLAYFLLYQPTFARQRFLALWLSVAVLQAGFGLWAYAFDWHGSLGLCLMEGSPRAQGFFTGTAALGEKVANRVNFYSAYLLLSITAIFLLGRRYWRWTVWGVLVLLGGIFVSQTRMTLLALFVAGAGSGLFFLSGWQRKRTTQGHVLGFLGRYKWIFFAPLVLGFLFRPALPEHLLSGGTDRLVQWRIAANIIMAHPVWGVGDGRYREVATQVLAEAPEIQALQPPGFVVRTPHNSLLYVAASYGVLSAAAYLLFWLTLLWGLTPKDHKSRSPAPEASLLHSRTAAVDSLGPAHRSSRSIAHTTGAGHKIAELFILLAFVVHDQTNNLGFVPVVALAGVCLYALSLPEYYPEYDNDKQENAAERTERPRGCVHSDCELQCSRRLASLP